MLKASFYLRFLIFIEILAQPTRSAYFSEIKLDNLLVTIPEKLKQFEQLMSVVYNL